MKGAEETEMEGGGREGRGGLRRRRGWTGGRRSIARRRARRWARRREGAPGMVSSLKMESGSPMAARKASYACLNLAYSGHAVWL
jgi:hypothetical protein